MEKGKFFVDGRGNTASPPTWNNCTFAIAKIQPNELNFSSGSNCFLNPNWGSSMDQCDPFESALSSIVSSPATSHAGVMGGSDSVVIRELMGKLGNICNSGDLSPQSYMASNGNQSTNTSCYSTPLNSPPKLNLSTMDSQIRDSMVIPQNHLPSHQKLANFSTDPGFVERAARLSCFGTGNLSGIHGNSARPELPYGSIAVMDSVQFSRVSPINLSVKAAGSQMGSQDNNRRFTHEANILSRSSTPENGEFRESPEGSLQSERTPGAELSTKLESDSVSRKRKSIPKGKSREITPSSSFKDNKAGVETEESNSKKRKSDEATGNDNDAANTNAEADPNEGEGDKKQTKDNPKPPEPPKDYIHVRARRGQATDSHSLAERVRREKISERMKFLQDLVPGCNKVTGKAVMLDEIINYVQSLQRQVEFLSMKLATVYPRMDFNMEALLSKDMFQSPGNLQHAVYSLDSPMLAFPYGCQPHQLPPQHGSNSAVVDGQFSMNTIIAALHKNPETHMAQVRGLSENAPSVPSIWEDDLQSLIQMGFGQNQHPNIQGSMAGTHMKIEL